MSGPRALVAPDSFKGTFSAADVADAVARGLERGGVTADRCPVADGGEGTMSVMLAALGGRIAQASSRDPLGRPVSAQLALLDEGARALVETAAASGLALLAEHERDPWSASTWGTGRLIGAAVEAGAREVLVAVGGSATVDGGRGALAAIEESGGLAGARITVLCDVATPWERCAEIYGPQKGADAAMVARLATRLERFADELARDPRGVAMTGAAGGLAGGLWSALDARLVGGADHVLDAIGFDRRLREVDAVIVGEGRIDEQSAMGKVAGVIARRALAAGMPAHAIVGRNALDPAIGQAIGLRSIVEATTLAQLEAAGERIAAAIGAAGHAPRTR
ncbi:MAG: glycerate kinase [Solirubrobacteraceae bacterium]|nr:glycerate kinase [Solirubrobacteraceae bacterium]